MHMFEMMDRQAQKEEENRREKQRQWCGGVLPIPEDEYNLKVDYNTRIVHTPRRPISEPERDEIGDPNYKSL